MSNHPGWARSRGEKDRFLPSSPAATFSNCCAWGAPKILAACTCISLPENHRLIHSRNALGPRRVCMNAFFSLTPGCFRFLGVFILFVCFGDAWLTSYKASIHTVVCEAVTVRSVAGNSRLPRTRLSESLRTGGEGRGKAPSREKRAELLKPANGGVWLAFFFQSNRQGTGFPRNHERYFFLF